MKNLLSLVAIFFSANLCAHPGHDHSLWFLDPFHISIVLFIMSILIIHFMVIKSHKDNKDEE